MPITKLPSYSTLKDGQFIQVEGPNQITSGYSYDEQQRALYFKESQVLFPSFHGATHIAEDPIPAASCDTPGLMSADDKCKLDALLQTRLGVLGFQGAGFPDDGGWLQGDIILAAGTEFISLERIGNVVRFTVDSPIPLNCACFKAGAQVLMADGTTKAIENIKIGDEVITHNRKIKKVTNTFINKHDDLVYNFNVEGHRQQATWATGNHPYLAVRAENLKCVKDSASLCRHNSWRCSGCEYEYINRTEPEWIDAKDLKVGDFLVSVFGTNEIVDTKEIVVSEWVENLAEINDQVVLTFTNRSGNIQLTSSAKLPSIIPLTNDILFFFGAYLAEGHTRNKNLAIFSVHVNELQDGELGSEIIRIGRESFGLTPIIIPSGNNAVQITFCSSILSRLLDGLFGCGVSDKRIPQFLMKLHPQDQKNLLLGLYLGDGHRHKKQNRIALQLANEQLINQVAAILQRQGHNPSVSSVLSGTTRSGTEYSAWTVTVQSSDAQWLDIGMGFGGVDKTISRDVKIGEYVLHRITEITTEQHTGDVYNFEVEDEHTYTINQLAVHNCEECQQIYYVQDETDIASIRPPTCGGKLPGVNVYGEMKIYLFPESTIADPNNVSATLNNKGNYPSMIFKRYDDTIIPGAGEYELVLKRDRINTLQTEIGWAFTPGATGIVECVWFTGKDKDGNQTRFELEPDTEPNLLGTILYKGHLISRKMAVIVDYTSTILSTNQYTMREWDVDGAKAVGSSFTARNVWQYLNPENPPSGANPLSLVLDGTIDLLPIGTLVELWWFKVGEVAGEPIRRYYFSKKPNLNPNHIWTWVGHTQFGDVDIAREEVIPGDGSEDKDSSVQVSSIRQFERSQWGLTGYDDPLVNFDSALINGTENADISIQHRAVIDTTLPGLKVIGSSEALSNYSERPVLLWNRHNICNALISCDIGRPSSSNFVPYDIILRAPIDENMTKYMRIVGKGRLNDGTHYIRVCGVHFHDIPQFGSIRTLSPVSNQNIIYNYNRKLMFPSSTADVGSGGTSITSGNDIDVSTYCDSIILIGGATSNIEYPGDVGDIVELLHQEYSSPVVRIEFSYNQDTELVEMQFKVGVLDMSLPYEEDLDSDIDDYIRGLAPGYSVSAIYSQAGTYTGVGTQPDASPEGFVVYDGGAQVGGTLDEYWNRLEIMLRDGQVWIWWNQLLIPPSSTLSLSLPNPVSIDTPYYPIEFNQYRSFGKVGARLWPGATVRRFDVRTQITLYNEFIRGQLEVT